MKTRNILEARSFGITRGMIVRIVLAATAVLSSLALAWFVMDGGHGVHAAGSLVNLTSPTAGVSPTATAPGGIPAGPSNKTWYFAEGRIGKGFREYLTIQNPGTNACAISLQYNYTPDGGTPASTTVTQTVAPLSRLTESVNSDLGITDSSASADTLAAIVNVNTTTTPTCVGVVAERPLYFTNFRGIASGTDVLGSTKLSKTFYFANVPSSVNYTSYLTILNPNTVVANISVSYYVGAAKVGQQSLLNMPANSRGTISPSAVALPTYSAAVVTSDQPIMVERPTYFLGFQVNGVTTISGAYDIVGTPVLANDWLFAEGYTSTTTDEFLTIANVDPAAPTTAATVTITLKSKTGATASYSIPVPASGQYIWPVNANNTFAGSSPEVSAEVTSTGAKIVVQREMYFTYSHTLPNGRVTTGNGGTDVIGQVGPAAHSAYTFAEGYSNTGYNEWLTIQNPTANAETIYLTLVNGSAGVYNTNFIVGPNSRYTQDISALVQSATIFNAGTNSATNSVSMTVQTLNGAFFVAERPMYWNTSGGTFVTQGGTDIVGYTGG